MRMDAVSIVIVTLLAVSVAVSCFMFGLMAGKEMVMDIYDEEGI